MGRVALVALPARSQCPRLGDRLSDVRARDPRAREPARDRGCRRADAGLRTRARPTYAPVNWLCPTARIAVVGTTPSANTMPIAYQTAARRLAAGGGARAALQAVKRTAAFSGFRFRLIKRIDALGVASYLGTASSAAQFELPHARLLHATSVRRALSDLQGQAELQRPVSAASLGPPGLRRYVYAILAPELALIPEALIVPLGDRVDEALAAPATDELLDPARCLVGFPHPSDQEDLTARAASHRGDGPPARGRRHQRHRAVARPRVHRSHADLAARRHGDQGTRPRPHHPGRRQARPLPTGGHAACLPRRALIMPTTTAG